MGVMLYGFWSLDHKRRYNFYLALSVPNHHAVQKPRLLGEKARSLAPHSAEYLVDSQPNLPDKRLSRVGNGSSNALAERPS